MSKTKKIISLLLTVALVMTMATVAIVSSSALADGEIHVVAGAAELCGSAWDPADTNNQMTWNADKGIYEKVFTNVAAGSYDFKVTTNYAWDQGDFNLDGDAMYGGPNATVTVDADGSTVTVGFDGTKALVEVTAGSDVPVDTTPAETTPAETTPAETTPAETTPTTGDSATVYFSNGKGWETVYIHYWDAAGAGTTWPGEAMEFAFTNEYSQDVYKYTVPAGTAGIIFTAGESGPQTQDIKEGIVNNAGFYIDMESTQNELGHWGYGTWTYEPTDTPVDTTPTETTPADTTPSATETTPADTTPSATETTPAETTPAGTGITVAGTTTDAAVDSTVKYVVDLTAARLFENIQAIVTYDADKLELVRIKSDDPDVEDWEVEGPAFCPNLDGVILNAGTEGVVKFNASKVAGYNFKEEKNLVTLEFKVKDTAANEIALTIEEMTIKGGDESYFTGGQAVITEGITVEEYLVADTPIVTVPTTEKTEPTTEKTEPTTEKTEPTTEKTEPTTEKVEPTTEKVEPTTEKVEPTTEKVEPTTEKVEPTTGKVEPTTAKPDATSKTEASKPAVDTPPTGAATYVYVVLAVLAMAACAVVVLRKKVNG